MEIPFLAALTWQSWLTVTVLATIFGLLIFTRIPADFAFTGGLGVLMLTGVLDIRTSLSGFNSTGLVTVALLYVVVSGLQETGALFWISHHVLGLTAGHRRAQLRLMAPVAALSAFLNNTPVVAMFIPIVSEWCRRLRIHPSQMMIPLSYASILGGMCTLIGTSTNLVVNGLYQSRYAGEGISMFGIARVGLPCAVLGILYVLFFSRRLLPRRKAALETFANPREYTLELQVKPSSPLIGKTIEAGGLRHLPGTYLAEMIRNERVISAVTPKEKIEAHDRLVFVGNIDSLRSLFHQQGLEPATDQLFKLNTPRHERCLVEAVVSDTCPLVGKSIRAGRFRNLYNAVVIAIARNGARIEGKLGDIVLRPGDTLLIESHAGFIPRQRDSRDFYLISSVDDSTPRRFKKAPAAILILLGMVALVAAGVLPMLKSAVLASILMLATGCSSFAQARKSIEWHVLIVIGATLGFGVALEQTGAAAVLARMLMNMVNQHPWGVLAVVYVITSVMTEIITNNGAAALMFPLAVGAADRLDADPLPFVFAIMIAASASFATPIGYQTNLMVAGPGGYRFSDYLRFGIPLNLIIGLTSILLIPLIWPL